MPVQGASSGSHEYENQTGLIVFYFSVFYVCTEDEKAMNAKSKCHAVQRFAVQNALDQIDTQRSEGKQEKRNYPSFCEKRKHVQCRLPYSMCHFLAQQKKKQWNTDV